MTCLFRFLVSLLTGILFANSAVSQTSILAHGSEWSDRFDEWFIIDEYEEEGSLETQWKLRDNLDEWVYDVGEKSGNIRRKWSNQPFNWELRSSDNTIVEMDIKWRNDLSEWVIKSGDIRLKFFMPDLSDPGYWVVDDSKYGYIEFVSTREMDPREWECYDELSAEVSFEIKMAMVFISIAANLMY